MNWNLSDFNEQQRRLGHALEHANLILDTDHLGVQEVLEQVLAFIEDSKRKFE